jgi:hypothetical protein
MLIGGLFAAIVAIPAAAFANFQSNINHSNKSDALPPPGGNIYVKTSTATNMQARQNQINGPFSPSLGGGMLEGNSPGQVTGPGYPQINTSINRPINDVQAGQGSVDHMADHRAKPEPNAVVVPPPAPAIETPPPPAP